MATIGKTQLQKLQKKHKTDDAIGKLFGITRQAVHQLRTKYGIPPVMNKHADRDKDILKDYKSGISGTQLAKKYKLSISQTYRIINGLNPASAKKVVKKAAKKSVKKAAKKVTKKPVKKVAKKAAKKPVKKVAKKVVKKPVKKVVKKVAKKPVKKAAKKVVKKAVKKTVKKAARRR